MDTCMYVCTFECTDDAKRTIRSFVELACSNYKIFQGIVLGFVC